MSLLAAQAERQRLEMMEDQLAFVLERMTQSTGGVSESHHQNYEDSINHAVAQARAELGHLQRIDCIGRVRLKLVLGLFVSVVFFILYQRIFVRIWPIT
jgi:hypothetical protein